MESEWKLEIGRKKGIFLRFATVPRKGRLYRVTLAETPSTEGYVA